jgi:hypothetical protein
MSLQLVLGSAVRIRLAVRLHEYGVVHVSCKKDPTGNWKATILPNNHLQQQLDATRLNPWSKNPGNIPRPLDATHLLILRQDLAEIGITLSQ